MTSSKKFSSGHQSDNFEDWRLPHSSFRSLCPKFFKTLMEENCGSQPTPKSVDPEPWLQKWVFLDHFLGENILFHQLDKLFAKSYLPSVNAVNHNLKLEVCHKLAAIGRRIVSSLFEPPSAELVLSSFCFRPFYPFPPPCSSLLCTSFQCFVHIFSFPASCAGTFFLQCQDWKSPGACFFIFLDLCIDCQVDSWHPPKNKK